MWFPVMIKYLEGAPFFKAHGYIGMEVLLGTALQLFLNLLISLQALACNSSISLLSFILTKGYRHIIQQNNSSHQQGFP